MSAAWVSGGRISSRTLARQLSIALVDGQHDAPAARMTTRCARVWRHANEALGPASGASAVWSHVMCPVADAAGWSPGQVTMTRVAGMSVGVAGATLGQMPVVLVALPWGVSQDGLQRAATGLGAESGVRWMSVCNGLTWRWYDASRPFAREHLSIDLSHASVDARVWQVLWLLGRPVHDTAHRRAIWLDRIVAAGAAEAAGSAAALRHGVATALAVLSRQGAADHDACLAQVFQWLFLLFAEARALRPIWNPAYARSYSLTALARAARRGTPEPGLHESVEALARLGRDGAILGATRISALNGPLFAVSSPRWAGRRRVDRQVAEALASLTQAPSQQGNDIDFAALGVEHLGSIYEHLMAPVSEAGQSLVRKRTGAFYTPRLLADVLVHRTLGPLVKNASSDQILGLRVVDPAMGSGALLASAHRYLVDAVEAAWVREGRSSPLDVAREERDALPRRVAEQCLFGVDVNGRAVQVARLSLWLLSLAPDQPLTWLDAHLRVGNSLVGASPALVLERAPMPAARTGRRLRHAGQLALFDLSRWQHEAAHVGPLLAALAARPTATAADAHEKSREFASLRARDALASWRARADAWCGAAMDPGHVSPALWRAVDDELRAGTTSRRDTQVSAVRERWIRLAEAEGCLHWALEFPHVFEAGRGGFDAVIANPPWEMLRGDLGSEADRASRRDDIGPLLRFVRRSAVYRQVGGHINSYQLFLERMLQVLRPAGRLGCLLPGSVLADHGAATMRRHLFERCRVDRISVFDNREALFPIHRSVRIVSIVATADARTDNLVLDDGAPLGLARPPSRARTGTPRLLTRALLQRASGDAEAIPHLRSDTDLQVLERLIAWPRLGEGGWGLRFGRELNATEDRAHLRVRRSRDDLVVVDGKHLQAFAVRPSAAGPWVREADAATLLAGTPWRRWRLAYRDVSSATNTRSLIVAMLPPGCVSTHTIFCLRGRHALRTQLYLCGMLNSLVADWFVRRYLGAHVTTRLMATLPVPYVEAAHPGRRALVRLTIRLMRDPTCDDSVAELHARAAALYGLRGADLACVASDFPRLREAVRDRMLGRLPALLDPPRAGGPFSLSRPARS